MKKLLIGGSITAVMALATISGYAMPKADTGGTGVSGFYVGGSLGGNYLPDQYGSANFSETRTNGSDTQSSSGLVGANVEYKFGFNGNLNAGYKYGHWRGELGFGYLENNMDSVSAGTQVAVNGNGQATFSPITASGDKSTVMTYMVNGYYDMPLGKHTGIMNKIVPYAGIGIGLASIDTNFGNDGAGAAIDETSTVFAYQGKLGAKYLINKNFDVYAEYTHLGTTAYDLSKPYSQSTGSNTNRDPLVTQSIDSFQTYYMNNLFNIGVHYSFNV